jgi:aspartate carbamoyltransferase regulatory subunit
MKELKVSKIKQGTVIDHIKGGLAPTVLRILGIGKGFKTTVIVAMNVKSRKQNTKDIVKVENQILSEEKINKIAIVSPNATINIIKDFKVMQKRKVELPKELHSLVRCPNRNCITNSSEEAESFFITERKEPLELRCHYCEELVEEREVEILV